MQAWASPEILPDKLRGYDDFGWEVYIEKATESGKLVRPTTFSPRSCSGLQLWVMMRIEMDSLGFYLYSKPRTLLAAYSLTGTYSLSRCYT